MLRTAATSCNTCKYTAYSSVSRDAIEDVGHQHRNTTFTVGRSPPWKLIKLTKIFANKVNESPQVSAELTAEI